MDGRRFHRMTQITRTGRMMRVFWLERVISVWNFENLENIKYMHAKCELGAEKNTRRFRQTLDSLIARNSHESQ